MPKYTVYSFFVNLHFATHGDYWHFVIVKGPTQVSVGTNIGHGIGLPWKVQCHLGLRNQAVPYILGKQICDTSKNTEEMQLEGMALRHWCACFRLELRK